MERRPKDGERGQILIITALVIATVFVGMALVLNSSIYAENLSSRETTESSETTLAVDEGFDRTEEMLARTNANHNATHEAANRNFTAMVDGWRQRRAANHANRGASLSVTAENRTNGTHVRQTNGSRDFTDASGTDADWTLASGVGAVSDYRMVVNREDLYQNDSLDLTTLLENSFSLNVTNGTASWELHVYNNSTHGVVVRPVVDGDERDACTTDSAEVEIDLVNGTVGGEPCPSLTFAEGLEGEIDLEYRDPGKVGGTYELRIDRVLDPSSDDRYVERGEGSPSATPNLYSVDVRVGYVRSELSLRRAGRLVAGEEVYRG